MEAYWRGVVYRPKPKFLKPGPPKNQTAQSERQNYSRAKRHDRSKPFANGCSVLRKRVTAKAIAAHKAIRAAGCFIKMAVPKNSPAVMTISPCPFCRVLHIPPNRRWQRKREMGGVSSQSQHRRLAASRRKKWRRPFRRPIENLFAQPEQHQRRQRRHAQHAKWIPAGVWPNVWPSNPDGRISRIRAGKISCCRRVGKAGCPADELAGIGVFAFVAFEWKLSKRKPGGGDQHSTATMNHQVNAAGKPGRTGGGATDGCIMDGNGTNQPGNKQI